MKFPKIEDCYKGDITSIEICVERSSANSDGVWITMWKNEYEHFQVSLIDTRGRGADRYKLLRRYPSHKDDELKAREEYKEWCNKYGCLPFP